MDHTDVEWFAIWNRDLPLESKQDPSSSGRDLASDHGSSSSTKAAGNDVNRDEDDDEESGILYKYAANQDEAGESLSRRIGLAQGLIDFARYTLSDAAFLLKTVLTQYFYVSNSSFQLPKQAEDGSCDDNAIRVVNSARQRMIFLRPEPTENYWVALPTSHAGVVHSRESSAASTVTPFQAQKSPTGLQRKPLTPAAYVNLVRDAYSEFVLLHGSFSYIVETRAVLQDVLKTFFDTWCHRSVNMSGLGVLRSSAMQSLPINDALLPFNTANLLILSNEGILHLPDSALVPHKSSLAIARHLEPRLSRSSDSEDRVIHDSKSKKHMVSLGVPHGATSTWKRTLSLGGLGGYMGLPGASMTTKPKVYSSEMNIAGDEGPQAVSGEKSWINPMNLFGSSTKAKAPPATVEIDTNVAATSGNAAIEDLQSGPKGSSVSSAKSDTGEGSADQEDSRPEDRASNMNMRRSASLGVSEALQAAIGADLHVHTDDVDSSVSQAATPKRDLEASEKKDIFIEETKEWKTLYILEVDRFILAYIAESPNVQSARRIAAACKKVLSGLPHASSLQYYHSNSISATDHLNIYNTALPTSALSEAHQAAASNAVADLARFTTSRLSELFVRTSLSTWLVARPAQRIEGINELSDITVLPKSVGKEGSLVDADAEIQRGG